MTPRRLYRSHDRQLAGVAGGMAEYLDVDPTVVRILWILAALFSGGILVLAYIILAFVIPQAPFTVPPAQGWTGPASPGTASWATPAAAAPSWSPDWAAQAAVEREARERSRGRGPGAAVIFGVILVVFGLIALADTTLPGWIGAAVFGPALVIALGAALLVASVRRNDAPATTAAGSAIGGYDATASGIGGYDATASAAAGATAEGGTSPVDTDVADPARAGTYDTDDTASVDLGLTADPTGSQPDTDPR